MHSAIRPVSTVLLCCLLALSACSRSSVAGRPASSAAVRAATWLHGKWAQSTDPDKEPAEFLQFGPDGVAQNLDAQGQETFRGTYRVDGASVVITFELVNGHTAPAIELTSSADHSKLEFVSRQGGSKGIPYYTRR